MQKTGKRSMSKVKRPAKEDAKGWRKEALMLRRQLVAMTNANLEYLEKMDSVMKLPSTNERGCLIAKATNWLEFQTDSARHFGLGVPLGSKRKVHR